eukprot:Tamp_17544.p4 GENE.Tamp_17544~~Tamp_17544.p4  ORF type:complete len:106 (-),score=8.04 Tamp_17544:517-834(-)
MMNFGDPDGFHQGADSCSEMSIDSSSGSDYSDSGSGSDGSEQGGMPHTEERGVQCKSRLPCLLAAGKESAHVRERAHRRGDTGSRMASTAACGGGVRPCARVPQQ